MNSIGKIILSSDNFLLSKIKLEETPSRIHGLNKQDEKDLRILGCEAIQTSGILLKLPQVAMATGQILFQRFYYSKSFIRYDMETLAMSCIFLASKIEESPRMIRDVLNVFHHMKQIRGQNIITPLELDKYTALKTKVLNAECLLLKVLGFCVHVKHPHKLFLMYLQLLGLEKNKKLIQCAWNYMNDSLRTDVFVRYQPEVIACACIYLAGRKINLPLPNNPPWYGLFKVEENDIIDVCYRIMELYNRPKLNFEEMQSTVEKLKTVYNETRDQKRLERNMPSCISTSTNGQSEQPLTTTVDRIEGIISQAVPIIIESKAMITSKRLRSRSRSRTTSTNDRKKSRRSPSRSRRRSDNNNNDRRKSRNRGIRPSSPRSRTSSKYHRSISRNHANSPSSLTSRTSTDSNKRISGNETASHGSHASSSSRNSSNYNRSISRNHASSPSSRTSTDSNKRASGNEARLHSSSKFRTSSSNNKEASKIHAKSPLSSSNRHSPRHRHRRTRNDRSPVRNYHRRNEGNRHINNIKKEQSRHSRSGRYSSNDRVDRLR